VIKINRVLVPTDFSQTSIHAIDLAKIICREFQANLNIIHARVPYNDNPHGIDAEIENIKQYENNIEEALLVRLNNLSGREDDITTIEHNVIRGISSHAAILDYMTDNPADLIVMGTHGHGGFAHFLLGSVAEMLVRYAPCPVITLHADSKIIERPKKILVPFDFSDLSRKAFHYAVNFARKFNSDIDLLYVIDTDVHPALYAWGMKSIAQMIPDIKERVSGSLNDLITNERAGRLMINRHFVDGKPSREILKFSKENKNDLIVIGTHGRHGVDKFLLGSVTEKVVRLASCSVLTVKWNEQDFVNDISAL
jgi:nucleotide-binding universal stress UspA family protein